MFLRCSARKKDGKEHRYFSIVENKRVADGRVVQRHVLYLGEINSSQELAWRKSIEVFEDGQERPSTLALFPTDRCEAVIADESVVRVRLSELELAPATPVGRVLAGGQAVAGVGAGSILERASFSQPQRDALGSSAVSAGGLPSDRTGAASGGFTASGLEAVHSVICSERTSAWRSPTSSMPAMIFCWNTNRRCSIIW